MTGMEGQDHVQSGSSVLYASSSATLLGTAWRMWGMHGMDPVTLAALAGGIGTLLMAIVNVSREIRAWLDRQPEARTGR